jgi:hypothetical protein
MTPRTIRGSVRVPGQGCCIIRHPDWLSRALVLGIWQRNDPAAPRQDRPAAAGPLDWVRLRLCAIVEEANLCCPLVAMCAPQVIEACPY